MNFYKEIQTILFIGLLCPFSATSTAKIIVDDFDFSDESTINLVSTGQFQTALDTELPVSSTIVLVRHAELAQGLLYQPTV